MIVWRGAPPRTGSCISESGFFMLSVPFTSRRQFLDLKYPLETKIMMTAVCSMYSSRAPMSWQGIGIGIGIG